MAMARFYTNGDFLLPAVEVLRRLGYNVLTMLEAGQSGQGMSDEVFLAFDVVKPRRFNYRKTVVKPSRSKSHLSRFG